MERNTFKKEKKKNSKLNIQYSIRYVDCSKTKE